MVGADAPLVTLGACRPFLDPGDTPGGVSETVDCFGAIGVEIDSEPAGLDAAGDHGAPGSGAEGDLLTS
ncbi:hypothetical protein PS9374_06749 [Planomonospora sphaerica]|uniref:Uncharacterized protein n=1 Tax=Planomonospora sphaerica TaxID=161355 RepID=A0A171DPS6_9ACTN|nr:hypothetical protein PS9374_06749 [Planomonospora sphaerica]